MTFLKLVNSLDPVFSLVLQVTVILGLGIFVAVCFRKTPTIRHCVLGHCVDMHFCCARIVSGNTH